MVESLMCVIDFDPPKFYEERLVRARKPYHCYECREPISIGETYQRCTGKWDADVHTYHWCVPCGEIAEAVESVGCSWLFGSLLADAGQAVSPDGEHWNAPPEKMGRLIGLFRACEERG